MKTERLVIRPIKYNDIRDISEYGCDEETGLYMIYWPKTKERLKDFVADCVKAWEQKEQTWYEFAVLRKNTDKVIGNITLTIKERRGEIGWISNKAYWGNGFMTEAAQEILRFAFITLGLSEVKAACEAENCRSYRVMEKCGMKRQGDFKRRRAVKGGNVLICKELTYAIKKNSLLYYYCR